MLFPRQPVRSGPPDPADIPTGVPGAAGGWQQSEYLGRWRSSRVYLHRRPLGDDWRGFRQPASKRPAGVIPRDHYPIWIESVWQDADGTIYGWYHNEPGGVCPNSTLTAPRIGALVSTDGGASFTDLGIVLSTGDPLNCAAKNGFFAGGHGD